MGAEPETVVFLHGMGAGPESWEAQLTSLPPGFVGFAPTLPGLRDSDRVVFSLDVAARSVRAELDKRGVARAHLCGLSLGAMVATRFAIDYPARTASLVLSGGQVRPNPVLMGMQNTVLQVLPARIVAPDGMSKSTLLAVVRAVAATDFRSDLSKIATPTLVLCGKRDWPNIPAARALAATIPGADLQIVPGAGHAWNTQLPDEFSALLRTFYRRISLSAS